MAYLPLFLYLQVLDLLTTLIGLRLGASEASPFVGLLIHLGPGPGLVASKLLAIALAALCLALHKKHVIRWASYWYALLILWNLCVILAVRHLA